LLQFGVASRQFFNKGTAHLGVLNTKLAGKINRFFIARLSLLGVVFNYFTVGKSEFPKDLRGFAAKRRLVQTYPLPRR